jgi:hypothetical protein
VGDGDHLAVLSQKEAIERLFRSRGAAPCGGGP